MAEFLKWPGALAWITAGFALLWVIDRFVYPVCPACSHPHDHEHCSATLHGFAPPLLLAAALHSALDGWSVAAARQRTEQLCPSFPPAIATHQTPARPPPRLIHPAPLHSPKPAL